MYLWMQMEIQYLTCDDVQVNIQAHTFNFLCLFSYQQQVFIQKLAKVSMSNWVMTGLTSVVSRAIFKLVYWLGIPNSEHQTVKSIKINSPQNRQMTIAELRERCFELYTMQNNQNGSHRGGLTVPFRLLNCTTIFFLTMLVKKRQKKKKKKIAGYATAVIKMKIHSHFRYAVSGCFDKCRQFLCKKIRCFLASYQTFQTL